MIGHAYDLGNAQINGGGSYQFSLKTIPEQSVVQWINLQIQCTVVASSAYTNGWVDGGQTMKGETLDDTDLVLAAILTSMDFVVSPSYTFFSAMSMPRLRTALAYINGFDFIRPASGTTIAASAGTTITFNIQLPLGMQGIIPDFTIFNQGSLRFAAAGQINLNYGPLTSSAFTGTFANGSTTFTIAQSSVTIRASARNRTVAFGPGLVGPGWQLTFGSGIVTTGQTKPGIHMMLLDQTSQTENVGSGYSASAYNIQNGATAIAQNNSSTQLINNFRGDRVQGFGLDLTARGVPMQYYPQNDILSEIDQSGQPITYQVTATGSQTLSLLELVAIPPNAAELQDIAQRIGNGGQVAVGRGLAKSMNGKRPNSYADTPLLPVLLYPAGAAPAKLPVMSPAAVGNFVSQAIGTSVAVAKAAQPYGKTGKQLVGRA